MFSHFRFVLRPSKNSNGFLARVVFSWLRFASVASLAVGLTGSAFAAEPSPPQRKLKDDAFAGRAAGEEKSVSGLKLCWAPAGKFTMGSPDSDPRRRYDEEPVEVTLTAGFWIGKYEVTQGEWLRLMEPVQGQLIAGKGENYPVYWVSFVEAEEFCRRLTEKARAGGELPAEWAFRLPTEAQWEYACRAGTKTPFYFGDEITTKLVNFGRPFRNAPPGFPDGSAEPVGSYPANPWGLHDMHGNEWEWCRDWYFTQLPGGTDPDLYEQEGVANRDGSHSRVRRGGAWPETLAFNRSAARLRFEPERRSNHIGFRVVLVRPVKPTEPSR